MTTPARALYEHTFFYPSFASFHKNPSRLVQLNTDKVLQSVNLHTHEHYSSKSKCILIHSLLCSPPASFPSLSPRLLTRTPWMSLPKVASIDLNILPTFADTNMQTHGVPTKKAHAPSSVSRSRVPPTNRKPTPVHRYLSLHSRDLASTKPTQSTLDFSCICSNGQQPNASQYSQTIPFYECTEAATQCVSRCASGDSSCQSACRADHPCGAQDPVRINTSITSTMAATSAAGSQTDTAASATGSVFGSSSNSGAGPNAQALALGFGWTYGLAMVLAGVTGGFIFIL